jgi:hypothetical protein
MALILNGTANNASVPPIQSDIGGSTTGMFFPSANVWAVSTSSTERMRITSNGGISFGASGTAYGIPGQVVQCNGDAPPIWANTAGGSSVGSTLYLNSTFGGL